MFFVLAGCSTIYLFGKPGEYYLQNERFEESSSMLPLNYSNVFYCGKPKYLKLAEVLLHSVAKMFHVTYFLEKDKTLNADYNHKHFNGSCVLYGTEVTKVTNLEV